MDPQGHRILARPQDVFVGQYGFQLEFSPANSRMGSTNRHHRSGAQPSYSVSAGPRLPLPEERPDPFPGNPVIENPRQVISAESSGSNGSGRTPAPAAACAAADCPAANRRGTHRRPSNPHRFQSASSLSAIARNNVTSARSGRALHLLEPPRSRTTSSMLPIPYSERKTGLESLPRLRMKWIVTGRCGEAGYTWASPAPFESTRRDSSIPSGVFGPPARSPRRPTHAPTPAAGIAHRADLLAGNPTARSPAAPAGVSSSSRTSDKRLHRVPEHRTVRASHSAAPRS